VQYKLFAKTSSEVAISHIIAFLRARFPDCVRASSTVDAVAQTELDSSATTLKTNAFLPAMEAVRSVGNAVINLSNNS
jgi:hypothetical protein